MTVDDWVYEAIESTGPHGATVREVQRWIDEHHYEELAVDTIETSLDALSDAERIELDGTRWRVLRKTSKEDAMRRLFGES